MRRIRTALGDPWVWGQFLLIALVLFGIPWVATTADPAGPLGWLVAPAPVARLAGLLPLLAGAALMLLSALHLGRNLTPATTPIADGEMIERGVYAHVRHPMYAGLILVLWGTAWLGGNWRMGLLTALVALLYFDRKAAAEERKLVLRYPGYSGYMKRVPKLIPGLGAER